MLGLGTNVLVRLLIEDDAAQSRRARHLVGAAVAQEEVVLVSLPVLLETEWVLRSRYAISPESILGLFRAALETRELAFEDEAAVEEALFNWQDGLSGFSDCLIVAHNRQLGCRSTAPSTRVPHACLVRLRFNAAPKFSRDRRTRSRRGGATSPEVIACSNRTTSYAARA